MRYVFVYVLVLITLVLSLPIVSYAYNEPSTSAPTYNLWSEQYYPLDDGQLLAFWLTPDVLYEFENVTAYPCFQPNNSTTTTSVDTRMEIYKLTDGYSYDNPTLIAYSDWTPTVVDDNCGSVSFDDKEVNYSFGWLNTLQVDTWYIIAIVGRNTISPLDVYSIGVTTATTTEFTGYSQWSGKEDVRPRKLGEYISGEYYGYTIAMNSSYYPATSTTYIDINSVDVGFESGTTSSYDCEHRSHESSYYTYCPIITASSSEAVSISTDGVYLVSDLNDYYFESWLLDSTSLPVGDSQYFALLEDTASYYVTHSLPPHPSDAVFNIRNSVIPLAWNDDDTKSATAQVAVVFCTTEDDCLDSFYEFTQSDGVTISKNDDIYDLTSWAQYPIAMAYNVTNLTLKYLFPFSVLYMVYDEFQSYESSFSTTTALESTTTAFYISLNMEQFGLPATTAGIPLSKMLYEAKNLSPATFDIIDQILWGLFIFYLTIRIVRGTWYHGLEYESSLARGQVHETRQALNTRGAGLVARNLRR